MIRGGEVATCTTHIGLRPTSKTHKHKLCHALNLAKPCGPVDTAPRKPVLT